MERRVWSSLLGFSNAVILFAALFWLAPNEAAKAAVPSSALEGPYADCSFMIGDAWKQAPLPDFNPGDLGRPLAPPPASLDARIVLCIRDSVVPALRDYRVLTEMHLPLFIRAGGRIAEVDTAPGRLHFDIFQGSPLSDRESQAVLARIAQMNATFEAAMRGAAAAPGVDLTTAYTPDDLAILTSVLARMSIPDGLTGQYEAMPANIGFTDCPPGADVAFIRAMASNLKQDGPQFRADMASGFDPPFTHSELVAMDRYIRIRPILFPTSNTPDQGKPPTAAEISEADKLAKNPGVMRFVNTFPPAMNTMMEHLTEEATSVLHQVCPAKKDATIVNSGLQSVTPGSGYPLR